MATKQNTKSAAHDLQNLFDTQGVQESSRPGARRLSA